MRLAAGDVFAVSVIRLRLLQKRCQWILAIQTCHLALGPHRWWPHPHEFPRSVAVTTSGILARATIRRAYPWCTAHDRAISMKHGRCHIDFNRKHHPRLHPTHLETQPWVSVRQYAVVVLRVCNSPCTSVRSCERHAMRLDVARARERAGNMTASTIAMTNTPTRHSINVYARWREVRLIGWGRMFISLTFPAQCAPSERCAAGTHSLGIDSGCSLTRSLQDRVVPAPPAGIAHSNPQQDPTRNMLRLHSSARRSSLNQAV